MGTLEGYCRNVLTPTRGQVDILNSKLNSISRVVQNNSSLKLVETRRGGSFEKGTMLRYKPEADIVLIFSRDNLDRSSWGKLRHHLAADLQTNFPEVHLTQGEHVALHLRFGEKRNPYEVDLVPSFYVNSPFQVAAVKGKPLYQGVTTIWHVKYVKQNKRLPFYKETVMLLKDWKNKHQVPLKSFHIELIVASAMGYRGGASDSLEATLRLALSEIQGMTDGTPILPSDWKYFTDESPVPEPPCIVDPANPKDNLISEMSNRDLVQIRKAASQALSFLSQQEYRKVFDPNNGAGYFG